MSTPPFPLYEFLVYADVLMSDIENQAKFTELSEMQDRALSPYLLTEDHTGLEPTLVRDWRYAFADDDYSTVQLWLAPDESTLQDIYARLPLVKDSRMTVQHVTRVTRTQADPGGPHLREHNASHKRITRKQMTTYLGMAQGTGF